MAFRFKDLMIQVIPSSETGGDEQICTLASKVEEDPAGAVPPCTPATSPAALVPCTLASKIEAAYVTCTPATAPAGIVPCTLASQIPTYGALAAGGGTAAAITTVTTVTTVTTLVGGGGAGAADLPSLKQQLRQALDQVEAQERAAAQAQPRLPDTVEEADDLARRLQEAIEELQEHRRSLQKPGAAAKKGRKGRK